MCICSLIFLVNFYKGIMLKVVSQKESNINHCKTKTFFLYTKFRTKNLPNG